MKQGMVLLLCLLGLPALAGDAKVYLLATLGLTGSTVTRSIVLEEPDIGDLQACGEAVRQGQRDGDWLKYHHIMRRDKMKGFSAQVQYRCVTSTQAIETWFDKDRYDYSYLVAVDEQSRMTLRLMESMAVCMGEYRALPAAEQAVSHCAKGNQRVR
ncbi:MAG TPA: hypothetical protein VLC30_16540 [Pseudomonas sp.]|nr:hypothetical protein [Pseudomonas sp.]